MILITIIFPIYIHTISTHCMKLYVKRDRRCPNGKAAEALEAERLPPGAAFREDVEPHGLLQRLRQPAQPPGEGLSQLLRQRVA